MFCLDLSEAIETERVGVDLRLVVTDRPAAVIVKPTGFSGSFEARIQVSLRSALVCSFGKDTAAVRLSSAAREFLKK